jgi:hypothetical protein
MVRWFLGFDGSVSNWVSPPILGAKEYHAKLKLFCLRFKIENPFKKRSGFWKDELKKMEKRKKEKIIREQCKTVSK